ncbi:MAG TPA: hypothetical protein PLM53_10945 [Spirochaetota bacterium]|nr:hypothetical protein [Spirochaetota bacterium]HPC39370.1 hypothetical protein [Spirochaetota bacterium]HPL18647.1 hypothetical protein [Spirochaetota bacterium]HQF08692.1 hypothetical protein [Spirochaetota bacterium]HQH97607.1 hypothetical protein [Spirochaetota bacterium]
MTFIIISVLAFLIVLVFRKYRTAISTVLTIMLALGTTTAVLALGMVALKAGDSLVFFNTTIGRSDFMYLIITWYIADILCSILIIRTHIAYRNINAVTEKKR